MSQTKIDFRFPICRDPDTAWVFGVCSGLAQHFGWSTALVRVIFGTALWASFGTALVVYLVLAFLMPRSDSAEAQRLRARRAAACAARSQRSQRTSRHQSRMAQL